MILLLWFSSKYVLQLAAPFCTSTFHFTGTHRSIFLATRIDCPRSMIHSGKTIWDGVNLLETYIILYCSDTVSQWIGCVVESVDKTHSAFYSSAGSSISSSELNMYFTLFALVLDGIRLPYTI